MQDEYSQSLAPGIPHFVDIVRLDAALSNWRVCSGMPIGTVQSLLTGFVGAKALSFQVRVVADGAEPVQIRVKISHPQVGTIDTRECPVRFD